MKVIKNVKGLYKSIVNRLLTPLLVREWKNPSFTIINERVIEYKFTLECLSKVCPSKVLDVGPGKSAWPHVMAYCGFRVTAIDEIEGYWRTRNFNRHYHIIKDDITQPKIKQQFDLITCISVLEHIPNYNAAIQGMFKLLKSNGHLVLTFPYNEQQYIENVYKLPGAGYGQDKSYVCQVFSRKQISAWVKEFSCKVVEQEYYESFSGDYWTFGECISPPRKVTKQEKHQLTCLLLQKM